MTAQSRHSETNGGVAHRGVFILTWESLTVHDTLVAVENKVLKRTLKKRSLCLSIVRVLNDNKQTKQIQSRRSEGRLSILHHAEGLPCDS